MCLVVTVCLHSPIYIKVKTKGRCTKPLIFVCVYVYIYTNTHTHSIGAITNPHKLNEI
jgi:hypothetical protein